jgi:hypothetical protein
MADDHGCLRVHRLYAILSADETGEVGCVRIQLYTINDNDVINADAGFFLLGDIFLKNKLIKYKN